jgi:heat shock transcription factor, other eukaryote
LEDSSSPGSSELENLALNIQGLGQRKQDDQQAGSGRNHGQGCETAELTDDFWEELLSEGIRGEPGELSVPEMERIRPPERYVDALAHMAHPTALSLAQ